MRLFVGFLAGVAVGLIVSRAYILSLKATLKLYQRYIHERLDQQWTGERHGEIPGRRASHESKVRNS
ncbi:MAG: hypothetical protein ACRD3O_03380 [Terriglobia bacterium]